VTARTVPERIETARLTIRAPEPGDADAVYEAVTESLEALRPWMPWAEGDYTRDAAATYVSDGATAFAERRDLPMLLYLRDTGTLVGSSGLHPVDWSVPSFAIGYWVRTSMAGRGYATEAAQRIAELAFADLGAERVEIWCDARNTRSAAVATRAGFTLEARLSRNRRDVRGELADSLCFVRLRDHETA
jgi:RimJ/RimL family protein N-acetyltransferase